MKNILALSILNLSLVFGLNAQPNWGEVVFKTQSIRLLATISIDGVAASTGDSLAAFVDGELRAKDIVVINEGTAFINFLIQTEVTGEEINFEIWDADLERIVSVKEKITTDGNDVGDYPDNLYPVEGIYTSVSSNILINEVDADNPGTDNLEFMELWDGGIGNTDLTGLVVVLYQGSNDAVYDAFDLDGYMTGANGYFLLGSTGLPQLSGRLSAKTGLDIGAEEKLQNGADAIALFKGSASEFPNGLAINNSGIIDAIVYDTSDEDDIGLLNALTPGQPQVNEDEVNDKEYDSNQRIPNGAGGPLVTSAFYQTKPTPGGANGFPTDITGSTSSEISVYPNPSTGLFFIETENFTIYSVSLLDISGQKLAEFDLNHQRHIDLSNFNDGFYFLQLNTNKEIFTNKIYLKK